MSVESENQRLVCDPWMGKANTGGWQSFPEFSNGDMATHLAGSRWVYISHLHDDHLDPKTLKNCGLLDCEFVIKRYATSTLKDRLKRLGVKHVHEIEPFTLTALGPFSICIFPQMTSNSSAIENDVNYDLDTSIAIKSDNTIFFNQVDNPLSRVDMIQVKEWIHKYMGPIQVAALKSGAASEYPHLFLDIDQEGEKLRIVERSLDNLVEFLNILSPQYYFPAGGTYLIPGQLSVFNKNIAQPSWVDIKHRLDQSLPSVRPLLMEGGNAMDISGVTIHENFRSGIQPLSRDRDAVISLHREDPYGYEALPSKDSSELSELLGLARENWLGKIKSPGIKIAQSITFKVYQRMELKDNRPDMDTCIMTYSLHRVSSQDAGELVIHIDARALYGCLTHKFVWNGVLGSLCLYERRPNIYHPNDVFSLNFLRLSHEQLKEIKD
jgi:UDP-MurNAc hydroxylase